MELYSKWIVKDISQLNKIDWNDVLYCGHDHVITSDGIRIDFKYGDNDIHKQQREDYNNKII